MSVITYKVRSFVGVVKLTQLVEVCVEVDNAKCFYKLHYYLHLSL